MNIKISIRRVFLYASQHRWRMTFFGLLLTGLLAGGAWWWLKPPKPPVYLTTVVDKGDIEDSVLASGVLQPIHKVEVGAQVSGQLKSLKVQLGQQVVKGQLLAEIDPQLAVSDLQIAQTELDALLAEQQGGQAKLQQMREEWGRQQALRAAGASTQREWQRARAAFRVQQSVQHGLQARIRKARYIISQQQTRLAYNRIAAPISGVVLKIDTKQGQTVIASQQAPRILTLGDLSRMEVWGQVSEADVVRIRPGQAAYFYLLGSPGQRHYGVVREIQPTPEKINNAMFFNVLFDVANPERQLRVEMTAQVGIVIDQQRDTLRVPLTALEQPDTAAGYQVKVLPASGEPQVRKVRIGLKSRSHAQVLEGLQPGERVLISAEEPPGSLFSFSVR